MSKWTLAFILFSVIVLFVLSVLLYFYRAGVAYRKAQKDFEDITVIKKPKKSPSKKGYRKVPKV